MAFGADERGEVGTPNEFLDPVCRAAMGLMGSGELVFSGTDARRGGTGVKAAIVVVAFTVGRENGDFVFSVGSRS